MFVYAYACACLYICMHERLCDFFYVVVIVVFVVCVVRVVVVVTVVLLVALLLSSMSSPRLLTFLCMTVSSTCLVVHSALLRPCSCLVPMSLVLALLFFVGRSRVSVYDVVVVDYAVVWLYRQGCRLSRHYH